VSLIDVLTHFIVFSFGNQVWFNLLYPAFFKTDNPKSPVMPRMIYDYTKSVLERVSFDPNLFTKELKKALKALLPYELEQLRKWLQYFTDSRPELRACLSIVME
jgi:hypothetical protein